MTIILLLIVTGLILWIFVLVNDIAYELVGERIL